MGRKCNVKAAILTGSTLGGLYLFLAALLEANGIETIWFSSKTFDLLSSIYPGLTASITGAFVGLLFGILCGGFCFGLVAWTYNWFSSKLKK